MSVAYDLGSPLRSNLRVNSPWTVERVETLVRMFHGGASAGMIARELGSTTRNAVIGKLHRLGLTTIVRPLPSPEERARREQYRREQKREVDRRRSTAMRVLRLQAGRTEFANRLPPEELPDPHQDDPSLRVSLLDLKPNTCRWVCDADHVPKLYCGQSAHTGSSYCVFHHVIVYRPRA